MKSGKIECEMVFEGQQYRLILENVDGIAEHTRFNVWREFREKETIWHCGRIEDLSGGDDGTSPSKKDIVPVQVKPKTSRYRGRTKKRRYYSARGRKPVFMNDEKRMGIPYSRKAVAKVQKLRQRRVGIGKVRICAFGRDHHEKPNIHTVMKK